MAVQYVATSHHSALAGAPDQSEEIPNFDNLQKTLVIEHLDETLQAPEGYSWAGESYLHTGYKANEEDPPGKYRYQGAFRKVTTTWGDGDVNTDVHFHPCIARLNLSPLSVHSWIHITPAAPQATGETNYRNATHGQEYGTNWSASAVHRPTSTDGLHRPGLPRYAYIADCEADLHGFWWLGDWAGPLLSLSNQVIAINLVTEEQKVLSAFDLVTSGVASLEAGYDATDPPFGQGFGDQPFQSRCWNVLGPLTSGLLLVQEETTTFTAEIVSDFATANITKEFAPQSFVPAPADDLVPEFSWDVDPPYTGTGTFYNWWVRDQLSSLGNGFQNSSINTTLDDTTYTQPGVSGTAKASFGTPRSSASGFSTPGFAQVNPAAAVPPAAEGEYPTPSPEGPFLAPSLAAANAIIGQRDTDLDTASANSRFLGFRQTGNTVRFVTLLPSTLVETTSWTPEPTVGNVGTQQIIRGQSTIVSESGSWAMLDLEENPNFPGYYRPSPRTPPGGYIGGSENNLSTRGMGQFVHYIFDQSTASRDQWSVRSGDAGNVFPEDAYSGMYFPEAIGGGAPTEHYAGGTPESVHLVTIFAPSPAGYERAAWPLAHSGCNYVSSGTKLIFLPRSATAWRHVNHLIDGVPANNLATKNLHQIVCLDFAEGAWSVTWTVDTYKLMGGIIENANTGLLDETSGDCLSNGILTGGGYLYCVLYGERGEYLCKFNATTGALAAEFELSDSETSLVTAGREVMRDSVIISNRRAYLCGVSNTGYYLQSTNNL